MVILRNISIYVQKSVASKITLDDKFTIKIHSSFLIKDLQYLQPIRYLTIAFRFLFIIL